MTRSPSESDETPMPQSPAGGRRRTWPPDTLVDLLRYRATHNGAQAVFTFPLDVDDVDPLTVTYAQVDERARAIGAWLTSNTAPGERAFIFYPPSFEFVTAFFGALYGGLIAVPAYPLDSRYLKRSLSRLEVMVDDAQPAVAFAPAVLIAAVIDLPTDRIRRIRWVAVESIADACAADWQTPEIHAGTVAVLQYTSGSTSTPKGVVLSHRNVLANLAMLQEGCGTTERSVFSSWVPLAHDMGLFGRLLTPVYVGGRSILTSPDMFAQRPIKWLAMISRLGATFFGAPNFGYESCVRYATPESLRELDLGTWELASVGSEIVQPGTIERFATTFAPAGFRREAFFNGYGLAEATLYVCGARDPRIRRFEKAALERNVVRLDPPVDLPTRSIVSAGKPPTGVRIVVVDPHRLARCAPGQIGEIWVAGDNVGLGYWNKPQETAETFQAYIAGEKDGPYLRTGDLGFVFEDELFVTGRLKDLIIIRGRNLHPRDLELTVERCHPALRPGCTAAFSVDDDHDERLVILQELRADVEADVHRIVADIRERIADEHELLVHTVVLLRQGALLKTTSGKVQRAACRAAYLAGTLDVVAASTWEPPPDASAAAFVPPRTPTEKKLAQLWQRVLDADRVGIHDNFVDLGGQSVQANQAIAAVHRLFRVELQPSHFFSETATIGEQARVVDALRRQRKLQSRRSREASVTT